MVCRVAHVGVGVVCLATLAGIVYLYEAAFLKRLKRNMARKEDKKVA